MAENAIFRHCDTDHWYGACDFHHYASRPHHCTPSESRAGLYTTCCFSCLLLELVLWLDCNVFPTVLRLLLLHSTEKCHKTFRYRGCNTARNTCCGHRICVVDSTTCACTPPYGRARGRAFS